MICQGKYRNHDGTEEVKHPQELCPDCRLGAQGEKWLNKFERTMKKYKQFGDNAYIQYLISEGISLDGDIVKNAANR